VYFISNSVELVLLTCAVTICLSGIMYDSPFLSDGSYPLRGLILAYSSIAIIVFSLIYFVVAFIWEIKSSKLTKKTKRQVMWSKLKGMKRLAVEDFKKREKKAKLSSLMKVTRKPMKFDVRSLKKLSNPAGGKESGLLPPHLILPTSAPLALSPETLPSLSSSSSGESIMDFGSDSTGALLSDSTDRSPSDMSSSDEEHSFSAASTNKTDSMSDVSYADEDDEDGSIDHLLGTDFAFSPEGQEHLEVISGQQGNEDSSSKTVSDNDEDSGISGNSASSVDELSEYENGSVSSTHSMTESDSLPPQGGDGGIVTAPKSKADENDDMPIIKPKPAHSIGQPSSDSSPADLTSSESDTRAGEDEGSEDEGLPMFTVDHLIAKPVLSTDSSSSDSSTSDSGSDSS
jgi:hypothetical protein